jgi:hypothetical protein
MMISVIITSIFLDAASFTADALFIPQSTVTSHAA